MRQVFNFLIACALLAASSAAHAGNEQKPLAQAEAAFNGLTTYTATLRSYAQGSDEYTQIIRFFYKRPGFIRMEFISPHKGALLAYSPETGKARLRPFGAIKPLIFTLRPGNRLIRSPQGHTVDRSHLGALIVNARIIEGSGSLKTLGTEEINGRKALKVEVKAAEGFQSEGVNRHLLWLDSETHLPIKAEGYDADGEFIEGVLIDDLVVGVPISNSLFLP